MRRFVALLLTLTLTGCSELVIEGNVLDRETARPIPTVRIDQESSGAWKNLGETDARGKYWILRHTVGDGRIRLQKSGYHPQIVTDSEFRFSQGFQLVPSGDTPSDFWSPQ